MKKDFSAGILTCLVSLSLWCVGMAKEDVQYKPLRIGTYTTLGMIKAEPGRQIAIGGGGGAWTKWENQPFSRTAVGLSQAVVYGDALLVSISVGGFVYYPLPQEDGKFWTRNFRLKGSVGKAAGIYHFGGMENPWLRLKMGYFPYKYNPDARNLGEYLFRSGTYPGTTFTGGWRVVNSAAYMASGFLGSMSFLEDRLKLDVGIFLERGQEPNYDLSPGIVASYNLGGILELGAGIMFSHLIPLVPEKISPEQRRNAYYTDPTGKEMPLSNFDRNAPGLTDSPDADASVSAVRKNGDPLVGKSLPAVGDTLEWETAKDGPFPAELASLGTMLSDTKIAFTQDHPSRKVLTEMGKKTEYRSVTGNGTPINKLSYYTFKGQKVMARAAIRPQKLLQSNLLGPNDLTIYGEVALLGIADQPFYYENKIERMPVIFGINLPTFKLLDVLALEFEYHKRRFLNTTLSPDNEFLPLHALSVTRGIDIKDAQEWNSLNDGVPQTAEQRGFDPSDKSDARKYQLYLDKFPERVEDFQKYYGDPHWWWSLYAKKTIMPGFRIHFQAARDHFRAIGSTLASSYLPIFHRKGFLEDWYWVFKLEFGG